MSASLEAVTDSTDEYGGDEHTRLFATLNKARSLDDLTDDELADLADAVRTARRRNAKPRAPRLPQRALALDALSVLEVPSTPRLVTWLVEARSGSPFDAKSLTAGRRDDRNAWEREVAAGRTPTPKLAPALHHERCEPVRALVTVSNWPLESRFVTPHSPRADHPRTLLAVLHEAERLSEIDQAASARLIKLAARLAVGLPGAGGAPGDDVSHLFRVADEEINRFGGLAEEERAQAAARAQMLPNEVDRVWGHSPRTTSSAPSRRAGAR